MFKKLLRYYYAGKAMQALITKLPLADREGIFSKSFTQEEICKLHQDIAESSFCYADAMIKVILTK